MRKNKAILGFLALSLLLSFVSALTVTTTPSTISENVNQGQSKSIALQYTITNPDNDTRTAILNLGNFPNGYLTADTTTIQVPANNQATGTISITFTSTPTTPANSYTGTLFLASQPITTTFTVQAPQPTGTCKVYTLPIPLSKSLESGTTTSQSIDVYVSKYCTSAINVRTNQPQMQKPIKFDAVSGIVEPAGKFTVIVNYDTNDVQRGTYNDNIVISGVDDSENEYNLNIPISVTVTNSISPVSNGSFSTLPSCSLSSNIFNLNQTYKLICNNIDANIQIQPIVDPSLVTGAPPYVEETSGSYTYTMRPLIIGSTNIKASFLYKNAPIGQFSQDIKIGAGNVPLSGNIMQFKFYPELFESTGDVLVRVIDNATGNILYDAKILLDGEMVDNNTIHLEQNKEYELTSSNSGYSDLVKKIALTPRPINFTLNSNYYVGDSLDFQTSPANATILLDDVIITLPYKIDTTGVHKVSASLLGFTLTTKNISISENARIIDSTPSDKVGLGDELFATVTRNDSNLRIMFRKDATSSPEIVNQTIGSTIKYEVKDGGTYDIYADGNILKSYVIDARPFWKTWWFWTFGVLAVIVLIVLFLSRDPDTSQASPMAFNVGNTNG